MGVYAGKHAHLSKRKLKQAKAFLVYLIYIRYLREDKRNLTLKHKLKKSLRESKIYKSLFY